MIHILLPLFERDLKRVQAEISAYSNEKDLWKVDDNISNSAGNMCLHLIGNLKWFIGTQLGQTGYVRQRSLEFTQKDIPKEELIQQLDETIEVVENTLLGLSAKDLTLPYPLEVFKSYPETAYFLVHLTTHLSYHLGQINYHRRILNK